ncbi:MAG: hypothetical protein Q4B28_02185 [bacterium]|nr:hypothetical protein [bacterium]
MQQYLSPQLAYYSANPHITLTQLQNSTPLEEYDLDVIYQYCEQHQIYGVCKQDLEYPIRLKTFASSPYLIYYQGNLDLL